MISTFFCFCNFSAKIFEESKDAILSLSSSLDQNFVNAIDCINKTKGNFRWMTGVWTTDDTYNQDDLGISRWYNNQSIFANISYEIFNPIKYFNQLKIKLGLRHGRRYRPSVKRNNNYELEVFFETKNLYKHRFEIEYTTINKDYFEDLFMEDAALIKEEILMFEELLKTCCKDRIFEKYFCIYYYIH